MSVLINTPQYEWPGDHELTIFPGAAKYLSIVKGYNLIMYHLTRLNSL